MRQESERPSLSYREYVTYDVINAMKEKYMIP
jgi:hypothetical protein